MNVMFWRRMCPSIFVSASGLDYVHTIYCSYTILWSANALCDPILWLYAHTHKLCGLLTKDARLYIGIYASTSA